MTDLTFSNEKITETTFEKIQKSNEECLEAAKNLLAIKITLIKFDHISPGAIDLDVKNNNDGIEPSQLADIIASRSVKIDYLECYLDPLYGFLANKNDKTICNFVARYSLQFFKDVVSVFSEKKSALRHYKNCDIYSFYICDADQLVISMLVFNLADDLMQTHYHIVKDVRYMFNKWINSMPEVKNASILLHNYAAKSFGNLKWYTSPLSKMGEILQRSGQSYSIIHYDASISDWMHTLSVKYNCGELFRINKEKEIYCVDS
jgi:hypothetical protein